MKHLLTSREVDQALRYPRGRSIKLAKAGLLPSVILPDGEIRFNLDAIEEAIGTSFSEADSRVAQEVRSG